MPPRPLPRLRIHLSVIGLVTMFSSGTSWAAPEVAVVGLHLQALDEEQNAAATERLALALEGTGRFDAVLPAVLRTRLAGREALVIEGAFLGQGRKALDEGRILYERAEFEDALASLATAVAQLREGLPVTTDNRLLIDALLLQGLTHFSLGDSGPARAAFEEVVRLDSGRRLDPVNYSGPTVAFFEDVRQGVIGAGTGGLEIDNKGEARVYVDGRARGTGAVSVAELPAGPHALLVIGEDGRRAYQSVEIVPGKTTQVSPDMSWGLQIAAASNAADRSRQAGLLYGALGSTTGTGFVLLAGDAGDLGMRVQLLDTRTGNWSETFAGQGDDPVAALLQAGPSLASVLDAGGTLATDKVQARALPLDIQGNALLLDLLLDPQPLTATVGTGPDGPVAVTEDDERRGVPWWVWAGGGVLVAGGATTAAVVVTQGGGAGGDATGTVTVGPMP